MRKPNNNIEAKRKFPKKLEPLNLYITGPKQQPALVNLGAGKANRYLGQIPDLNKTVNASGLC